MKQELVLIINNNETSMDLLASMYEKSLTGHIGKMKQLE